MRTLRMNNFVWVQVSAVAINCCSNEMHGPPWQVGDWVKMRVSEAFQRFGGLGASHTAQLFEGGIIALDDPNEVTPFADVAKSAKPGDVVEVQDLPPER